MGKDVAPEPRGPPPPGQRSAAQGSRRVVRREGGSAQMDSELRLKVMKLKRLYPKRHCSLQQRGYNTVTVGGSGVTQSWA